MNIFSKVLFAALAVLAIASSEARRCIRYKFITLVSTASDSAGLQHTVEKYRKLLGGKNNGNDPGPLPFGQRSIDWDAGIVPFDMPFDFFDRNVTRGAVFKAKGNMFAVSNPQLPPPIDDRFSSLLPTSVSKQFRRFSLERLFTPVLSNEVIVRFKIPATSIKARVRGFGAVFTDVDIKGATSISYFDDNNCLIARIPVPPRNEGLSFAGIVVVSPKGKIQQPVIAKAVLKLGTISVKSFAKRWAGHHDIGDLVVLDDLLYAEPEVGH